MPTFHENPNIIPTNDKLYVNSEITGTVDLVSGSFQKTFNEPFLKNPEDFYASITRFSISGAQIPLKIWRTQGDNDVYAYAPYGTNFDLIVQGVAGSAVVNGSVSLTSNWVSFPAIGDSLDYPTALNGKSSQRGCVRFTVRQPAGSPASPRTFYYESRDAANPNSEISLTHLPTGQLRLVFKDSGAVDLINTDIFAFAPVLNQPYEFELNYDLDQGYQKIYLDGTLIASFSVKGTRDVNVDLLRIGSDLSLTTEAGFEVNYINIFSEVQHLGPSYVANGSLTPSNRTEYQLSLTSGGVTNTAYVYYSNANLPPPRSYNKGDKYYWDYSWENILSAFNDTLAVLHASHSGIGSNPAFFRLDNNVLNLVIPYVYFTSNVVVGCNLFSYNHFATFSGYRSNSDFKFTNYYDLKNTYRIWGEDETSDPTYLVLQERGINFLNKVTSFRSVVFTSQQLPIRREKVSNPDNPNGYRQIITDFYPNFDNISDFRQDMTFVATGNYKLINLQSSNIAYTLDWIINWVDEDGDFYVIQLDNNCSASVKFAFFKRETFSG